MKRILAMTAALALAGCATDELVVEAPAPEAPPRVDPDSIEVAAVIELEPRPVADRGERCKQEAVVGSRISRQRCYRSLSGADERLNEDMKRLEIEYARDMALLEEQLRMQELVRRRQSAF